MPATDLARTILDLGRFVSDQRSLRAIEWGRRTGALDWATMIATLSTHARRGRPGIRRLRRVILENVDRAEVTDSDFELLFLALLAEHGFPTPILHHKVFDHGRFVAEVDLAFPHLKIAIELDGAHHLESEVRERDLPRQNDLVLLGWTVLRFSWSRFAARPEQVLREVRAALGRSVTPSRPVWPRSGLESSVTQVAGVLGRSGQSCGPRFSVRELAHTCCAGGEIGSGVS